MIYGQFASGAFVYLVLATISYHKDFQQTKWYFLVGIIASVIANATWLFIAKSEPDPSKLVLTGLYWDVMLTLIYASVPFLLFKANLGLWQAVGMAFICIGIVLTKIA